MKNKKYTFVIDTNSYAGNFERQLASYMTGICPDGGHGEYEAELFLNDFGQDKVDEMYDLTENGTENLRYFLFSTKRYFNNGLGGIFEDWDEKGAVKHYNDYAKKNLPNHEPITLETLEKFPAYNSVGIYLYRKPTKEESDFFRKRATKYFAKNIVDPNSYNKDRAKIKLLGFRLIEESITEKEISLP